MSENNRCIIHGMNMLFDGEFRAKEAVVIEANRIKAIIPENMIQHHLPARQIHYHSDHYLIPGLIDLHIHGANGHDVMDATPQALHHISNALAREGVTSYLATTITADAKQIEAAIVNVVTEMQKSNLGILGLHLEGPFISNEKAGAQNLKFVQNPNVELVKQWQQMANGAIKILTLAPELQDAIELIKHLKNLKILAAIGHTDATYEQTEIAIDAGAHYATHLFNAMRGIMQREPGATGALLLDDRVYAELIVDNFHLHPAIVELALRVKSEGHLLLVSDAMRAKCLGDGKYDLGGQNVNVKAGKATLDDGRLAGSTLQLPQAIKIMAEHKNCGFICAIKMATLIPARILGIDDKKGTINVNKDADLAIFNADLKNVMTMRGGEIIFMESN